MKNYIEIQRNTKTFAQFLAQCRAACRNHPAACYASWADYLNGAREEMETIEAGGKKSITTNTAPIMNALLMKFAPRVLEAIKFT